MVIAIGGTADLWARLIDKDQAFKQRLNSAVKEELIPLTSDDYIDLFQKLIKIWDCVFQRDIKNRVKIDDVSKWVKLIESAGGGGFIHITVRQALGDLPTTDTSFLRKLDYLVDSPNELGKDVFQ